MRRTPGGEGAERGGLPPRWVAVGRITRAHGVRGEVSVLPLSQVDARFEPGSRLSLDESGHRHLTVRSSRPHRGRLLVSFEEVGDRSEAEALGGRYLFVRSALSPPLPEGEYWTHELIGCEVTTTAGRVLGEVAEVIHGPANDVWVVRNPGGEVLVPALKDVVVHVAPSARRVVVAEVPGLTAP